MSNYIVLSEKGVAYTQPEGGDLLFFVKGETIRQSDIDKRLITVGGLESLASRGIVGIVKCEEKTKKMEAAENKKMESAENKKKTESENKQED